MWPSKSLSRSASAAFAPASPPPTMTNVVDLVMNPAYLAQQFPQRQRVAHRVAAEVVVEVHPHVAPLVVPGADALGPPPQIVGGVGTGVHRGGFGGGQPYIH